jgi:LmbE family N-acetylglucosaminyl deacetylase
MTAGEALKSAESFRYSTLTEQLGEGGFLVIAPHPDDESLGCGGLIAEACAQGRPTRVVIVSDGSGSHPTSKKYPRGRLRALRESEARRAASALGLAPHHVLFLRLPDRCVPNAGRRADAAAQEIAALLAKIAARALFVTWRHDPHCDHQASYLIARAAQRKLADAKLYEYSIWGAALPPAMPVLPPRGGFRLAIDRHLARKRRAIAAHRSQTTALIDDDPGGFRLRASDLARFTKPFEFFFESTE